MYDQARANLLLFSPETVHVLSVFYELVHDLQRRLTDLEMKRTSTLDEYLKFANATEMELVSLHANPIAARGELQTFGRDGYLRHRADQEFLQQTRQLRAGVRESAHWAAVQVPHLVKRLQDEGGEMPRARPWVSVDWNGAKEGELPDLPPSVFPKGSE
jgi:hypothetical protein